MVSSLLDVTRAGTGILNRNKSLTRDDKNDVSNVITRVIEAAERLRSHPLDKTVIIGDADADVGDSVRDVVREELAKFRGELVQRPPVVTYAAAAASASGVSVKPTSVKTPISRPALVIGSSSKDVKTSKDVVDVFRKDVTFRDVGFAPTKVQHVSNGKVRVEFADVSQRDVTLKKLASVVSLRAEPARRVWPLVIVKGVSRDVDPNDVIDVIGRQNPSVGVTDVNVRFRFLRRNRKDDLYNVVLEVRPDVRLRLLELGRVNVDHQRVSVSDFSSLVQCYRCLRFGHTQAKCSADVSTCSHCAASGHDFASCPVKSDADAAKCVNCCSKSGRQSSDVKHSATSVSHCPTIKSMQRRIASRVDYGVSVGVSV